MARLQGGEMNQLQQRIKEISRMHHKFPEGSRVVIRLPSGKLQPAEVRLNTRDKVFCVFACSETLTDARLLYPSEVKPFVEGLV